MPEARGRTPDARNQRPETWRRRKISHRPTGYAVFLCVFAPLRESLPWPGQLNPTLAPASLKAQRREAREANSVITRLSLLWAGCPHPAVFSFAAHASRGGGHPAHKKIDQPRGVTEQGRPYSPTKRSAFARTSVETYRPA